MAPLFRLIMAKELNKMNSNNNIHIKKHRKGYVLLLTLFAALMLPVLIIAYINIQTTDLTLIKNRMCSTKAYYIAEAGIADALNEIRENGKFPVDPNDPQDTQWEKNFPDTSADTYSVSVSQDSTVITSTGHAAASNFSRTLEVTVGFYWTKTGDIVAIEDWKEITQ